MADEGGDVDNEFLLDLLILQLRKASPTPEGLVVEVSRRGEGAWVQEIGGNGFVVYEFPVSATRSHDTAADVVTLLERLHALEQCCEEMAGEDAKPIDFPIWKQTRKRARRRLRRWLAEHPSAVIPAPEHLSYLIPTLPHRDAEDDYEFDSNELLRRFYDEDEIGEFYHYTCRRLRSPVVVAPEIPSVLRTLLEEAREAFCRGLFRATIAICRAVTEETLGRKYDALSREGKVVPIASDSIKSVASALGAAILPDKLRSIAFRIAEAGNRAMHEGDADFEEVDAWAVLTQTCILVRFLSGGGYPVLPRRK